MRGAAAESRGHSDLGNFGPISKFRPAAPVPDVTTCTPSPARPSTTHTFALTVSMQQRLE